MPPDALSIHVTRYVPAPNDVIEVRLVFDGLVNPPGPLGLAALPFDPFRFGPSPLLGFVEMDADDDRNTGGEIGSGATFRYLANVARFGEKPYDSIGERAAEDGGDLDGSFWSDPQFERNGADFAVVFCGCFDVEGTEIAGDGNSTFDAGDTWIVEGRFFQRAGGYEEASAVFGGSFFGLYDPIVPAWFSHDVLTDRTTVTIQFPLTMQGAALLTGEPVEPIDLEVLNHTSIVEALEDIIAGAGGTLPEPTRTLTERWFGQLVTESLDPDRWRITGLFGTSYQFQDPAGALYVWTDAAGAHGLADFDGSGTIDALDVSRWDSALAWQDGGPGDADGLINGTVTLPNPGLNFSLFDLTGDFIIDAADRALIVAPPTLLNGDANGDCLVNFSDVTAILTSWGTVYAPGNSAGLGDANHDGTVSFVDITATLTHWGAACP